MIPGLMPCSQNAQRDIFIRMYYQPACMEKKGPNKVFNVRTFMVWFFIIIMSFSIGGFLFNNGAGNTRSVKYNGFNIYTEGSVWLAKVNGQTVPFRYLPSDLEPISVGQDVKEKLQWKPAVYLTFDPHGEDLGITEITRLKFQEDFGKFLSTRVINGVDEANPTYNLPVITCQNATGAQPVIYLLGSNDTALEETGGRIYSDGYCIIMEGPSGFFLGLKDRLMYVMVGIMN